MTHRSHTPDKQIQAASAAGYVARVQSLIVLVSVIAVGIVVSPAAKDVFRYPKTVWVLGESIALLTCWAIAAIYRAWPRYSKYDGPVFLLAGAVIAWTWLTSALSSNHPLSLGAATTASAIAIVTLTAYLIARERNRISDLWFLLVPGVVNAIVAISQSSGTWNPFLFTPETPLVQRITGFVGNPNELGTYLALPFLVASALLVALPRRRWLYGILGFLCLCGLFASRARTAMIAAAAGLCCLIWIATKRRRIAAAMIVAIMFVIAATLVFGGFITRDDLRKLKTIDGLNAALTYRVTPSLAAWKMFKDHPLFGLGPGTYPYWYFDYKIAVERDHPPLFHTGQGFSNFGEAHNDHAQVLAETGVPGYLLFLATLVFVGWQSSAGNSDSEAARVGRLLAFPAAVTLLLLCVAQFPLRIASASMSFAFVFGTLLGWLRQ